MLRIAKWFLVAALAVSVGLHWAFLQSVAWVGMVVNYSQSAPLTVALAKTFDGQHPCKLCKLVKAGQRTEKQQEAQKPVPKLEFFFTVNLLPFFPPMVEPHRLLPCAPAIAQADSPPVPPPRAA